MRSGSDEKHQTHAGISDTIFSDDWNHFIDIHSCWTYNGDDYFYYRVDSLIDDFC